MFTQVRKKFNESNLRLFSQKEKQLLKHIDYCTKGNRNIAETPIMQNRHTYIGAPMTKAYRLPHPCLLKRHIPVSEPTGPVPWVHYVKTNGIDNEWLIFMFFRLSFVCPFIICWFQYISFFQNKRVLCQGFNHIMRTLFWLLDSLQKFVQL